MTGKKKKTYEDIVIKVTLKQIKNKWVNIASEHTTRRMTAREVTLLGGSPWGFRMHGGHDLHQPLRVSRVSFYFILLFFLTFI